MSCEKVRHSLVGSPDQARSAPVDPADLHLQLSSSSAASPLALVDAVAAPAQSAPTLARYHAYKEVLLVREPDPAAIASTLTWFVWDLSDSR